MTRQCKACRCNIPKKERREIFAEEEIVAFLRQSHISKRNFLRLAELGEDPDERIAGLAKIVRVVGRLQPYKRKRIGKLARRSRFLVRRLEETGLLMASRGY